MRIFVTGATGFIGAAVVDELLAAGHSVIGMTRSEAGAWHLRDVGATAHFANLDDIDSILRGVKQADAIIHTAFNHDFSKFAEHSANDRHVIEAMGEAVGASGKPLIITSGTGLLAPGGVATEDQLPDMSTVPFPRVATEVAATGLMGGGTNVSVVRLPPSVHGDGDHGFVPMLIAIAREKGVSAYVGEGLNHWPAVHRRDAAQVFRLAAERGIPARYHATAEEGVPLRDIATVIGRRLGLPTVSITPEQATEHFGWFAGFAAVDNRASSQHTRQVLNWEPKQPGLIVDLDRPQYFAQ
ncbi:SDR family oxidoreductase [Cupriavidus consociatus]|uniref:SDR family oxidoreductase n=1 Tax=Cupriavidus consociatus TaxID=2821357 RepID=UPI001AE813A2|nr:MULTISPECIES: SDR family oxidoreductase [unclassified Cupriavidus]MBP0623101.1 SDR family oxidoreductase [Cupriavidus sp. LEh25]MDK2659792.1 SDR family oxidoreductase [Cupriavidus sp. LEh21]